ncbi:hypothetical protein KR018_004842 [Drosophila ironensis]|nr:hypothetical protein KR018_004842 [Drosophila ironensis]
MSFSFTPTTNAGAPAAAPATGGFNFGARPATTNAPPPAFGATSAATPAFGAATATPTFGAATATPTFGAATATPAFGAPAATGAAPAFGATSTASAPAFGAAAAGFGAPAPAFGAASTAAPAFGAAAPTVATVAPTFNFATPTTTAPTTAPPAFGFSTATTTNTPAIPSSLGGGIGSFAFGKPAQATGAASLNFGTTTTTATGLKLGGSTATTALGGGGIFGKPAGQPAAAPAPAFVGLGGIDVSGTQPKLGDNKQDGIKIKETQVPEEIVKTVEALKSYIKQQKTSASDIGRTSISKFNNVDHEISQLKLALQTMANSMETNHQQIRLLRQETSRAIQSLEMAQRTQDTPAGLQFEHSAPLQYFQCLVAKYEQDLVAFRQQIGLTERHMQALSSPKSISPDDLKRGFRQLNESFISLAGRLHELHQRVEEQKEHYLNLRRFRLRDATNVFERIDNPPLPSAEPHRISSGPTPFSNISVLSSLNKSYAAAAAANTTGSTAGK